MNKFEYSEDDRLYLQMMQDNISRMASNSANCKTWTVTIVAAFLAIGCGVDKLNGWIALAFIPIVVFWYLDTFYLHLERGMRNRQKDFLNKAKELLSLNTNAADEQVIDDYNKALFQFAPLVSVEEDKTKGIVSTTDRFFSKSIAPFYGSIAICVLVVLLVLNWELLLQLLCCSD
ncbi:MAG: hypothetical protein IJX11_09145 [Bacteroidales bacterium]|nr:hypothetical protein [Bacteroidales bacterium]